MVQYGHHERVERYFQRLTGFGYPVKRDWVDEQVTKFEDDPEAKPVGGPDMMISIWIKEEADGRPSGS